VERSVALIAKKHASRPSWLALAVRRLCTGQSLPFISSSSFPSFSAQYVVSAMGFDCHFDCHFDVYLRL
jgi:hypothetical protein